MTVVNNINEAMNFFLSNSSGSVLCKKNGTQKECNCFPDAKEFFETN